MKGLTLIKTGCMLVSKHKSAIMVGCSILTGLAATCFGIKATIDAVKEVEEATEQKQVREENAEATLTKTEIVKTVWKNYIPSVILTATSITLIVCAHRVDAKRIAAAASALALSEKMNKELRNKTIEEFGKEKADEIKNAIFKKNPDVARAYEDGAIQKEIASTFKSNGQTYECVEEGSYRRHCWFRDSFTGREFWSTRCDVERAVNKAVRDAINGGCPIVTLNSWHEWLGLVGTPLGDMVGWNLDRRQELDICFESDITDDGLPCLVINYVDQPALV